MERFNGLCCYTHHQELAGKKLLVVVHGQGVVPHGPALNPNWVKGWAKELAVKAHCCAIALYRPGYGDGEADHVSQPGDTGGDHRDNLTLANMTLVMGALRAIKMRYKPARFGFYGHSGGGGVGFIAMGWQEAPFLVDRAVLTAPLGDISGWDSWTRSLNPLDFASSPSVKGKRAHVFYSTEDEVVRYPRVIKAVNAMRQRGAHVLLDAIQGSHFDPYYPELPKPVTNAVDAMMKLTNP